jgi:hypothetical protein
MSNFLFRMVERAAGLSAAASPQPPRRFQWPARVETPRPVASVFDSFPEFPQMPPTGAKMPFMPLEPVVKGHIEQGRRIDIQVQPETHPSRASSFQPEAATGETHHPSIQAPVDRGTQREPELRVEADGRREAVKHSHGTLRQDAEPPLHEISGRSIFIGAPDAPVEALLSTSQPVARPLELVPTMPRHEANTSLVTARTLRPAAEAPAPQESRAQADIGRSKQVSEPPVEVKIGHVEIRFDAPVTPAPSRASSQPSGFSEYAALRRYAVGPWGSGNR